MITKVQSNNNSINFGALKTKELGAKAQKFLSSAGDFSSVHQRVAIGTSALLFQSLIDYNNKDVDKDTRIVSAIRSATKAVIGTVTGIIIRGAFIRMSNLKYAKKDASGKMIKEAGKIVLDQQKLDKTFGSALRAMKLSQKNVTESLERIPSVIGTLLALVAMIASNFLVDAPLTNLLSDKLETVVNKHLLNKKDGGAANV